MLVMPKERPIGIRATSEQEESWKKCAKNEERPLSHWVRLILDAVADSGLTVLELRELLTSHKKSSPPRKKTS